MLPDPSSTRRRLVMIAAAGAVLVVLIGVGLYGLTVGAPATPPPAAQSTTDPDTRPPPTAPPSSAATTAAPPGDTLPALPHTDDPIVYARAVAEILLAWDTMSALAPGNHAQQVLEDADPAGLETPVLAADVANYLPTIETWQQLRGQRTVQSVTIHTVYIPASWDGIATSPAAEQQLREGTVAVTIEATRHRAGVWLDEAVKADHPTAFTVFLACPPAFDRCHTLRLSRLDEPLP